jgi:coenzyme F420-reducing hydrogenase gamma subunit
MPEVQEALTLRLTREDCDCRYAVIGAGYFCLTCGHNSAPCPGASEGHCGRRLHHEEGDTTYAVGQRLMVREAAVLRFAELSEALVAGMRRDLPS